MSKGTHSSCTTLTAQENDLVVELLGPHCRSLVTTQATLQSNDGSVNEGVLCLVNDQEKWSFFLKFVCLKSKKLLCEHEVYKIEQYKATTTLSHTFRTSVEVVRLDFTSEGDAALVKTTILRAIAKAFDEDEMGGAYEKHSRASVMSRMKTSMGSFWRYLRRKKAPPPTLRPSRSAKQNRSKRVSLPPTSDAQLSICNEKTDEPVLTDQVRVKKPPPPIPTMQGSKPPAKPPPTTLGMSSALKPARHGNESPTSNQPPRFQSQLSVSTFTLCTPELTVPDDRGDHEDKDQPLSPTSFRIMKSVSAFNIPVPSELSEPISVESAQSDTEGEEHRKSLRLSDLDWNQEISNLSISLSKEQKSEELPEKISLPSHDVLLTVDSNYDSECSDDEGQTIESSQTDHASVSQTPSIQVPSTPDSSSLLLEDTLDDEPNVEEPASADQTKNADDVEIKNKTPKMRGLRVVPGNAFMESPLFQRQRKINCQPSDPPSLEEEVKLELSNIKLSYQSQDESISSESIQIRGALEYEHDSLKYKAGEEGECQSSIASELSDDSETMPPVAAKDFDALEPTEPFKHESLEIQSSYVNTSVVYSSYESFSYYVDASPVSPLSNVESEYFDSVLETTSDLSVYDSLKPDELLIEELPLDYDESKNSSVSGPDPQIEMPLSPMEPTFTTPSSPIATPVPNEAPAPFYSTPVPRPRTRVSVVTTVPKPKPRSRSTSLSSLCHSDSYSGLVLSDSHIVL